MSTPSAARRLAILACLTVIVSGLAFLRPATGSGARHYLRGSHGNGVTRKKAMWGPVKVDGVSQFPVYRDLGVGIFQIQLFWNQAAPARPAHPANPNDPAYQWPADVDYAYQQARQYGMKLMIQVIGAPGWANGGRGWNWAPTNARDYAHFVAATSRRYPDVHLWMVWGEPCRANNFNPMFGEKQGHFGKPLAPSQKIAPHRYARILDAAYGALKRVNHRNLVIGGNTFTQGGSISPLNWIKNLRLPNGRTPRMDMYGHNPISARRPDLRRPPLGHGYADFSDLDTLAGWLDRYLHPPNMHGRPLPMFLSEFVLPTDHFGSEINFFVDRHTQARWTADALRIARHWKRIYTFGWLQLYDDPPVPSHDEYTYGLIDAKGVHKPAYAVFRDG